MRSSLKLAVLFPLVVGACARNAKPRVSPLPVAVGECSTVMMQIVTKGKGAKAKVDTVSNEPIKFSEECGKNVVAKIQANIELARVNAASQVLSNGIGAADPVLKAAIARAIVDRMDSKDAVVSASQVEANAKAGLSEAFLRTSAAPKVKDTCQITPVLDKDGKPTVNAKGQPAFVFICN